MWIESPGSTTMEISDIDQIVTIAKERGILTGCDNTWASPLLFKPLQKGIDVVAEAITKYMGGHSDFLLGSLTFLDAELYRQVRQKLSVLGIGVSPDNCSLALRGLETLAVRLERVGVVARNFAERLVGMKMIEKVLHPAVPTTPGHAYWSKAFSGSSGVFSIQLKRCPDQALDEALSQLRIFALGASWGGTRSVIAPMSIDRELGSGPVNMTGMAFEMARDARKSSRSGANPPVEDFDAADRRQLDRPSDRADLHGRLCRKALKGVSLTAALLRVSAQIRSDHSSHINGS